MEENKPNDALPPLVVVWVCIHSVGYAGHLLSLTTKPSYRGAEYLGSTNSFKHSLFYLSIREVHYLSGVERIREFPPCMCLVW